MKTLPNECTCTDVWASPENWKTVTAKSSLKKNWYVQCVFYDPLFADKYPKGFPYRKKLNKFKTLELRKAAVQLYLDEIPKLFEEKGWNPITKTFMIEPEPEPEPDKKELEELLPETPFLLALSMARKSKVIADSTDKDIKYMLVKIEKAAKELRFDNFQISEVKRKHIRSILDYLERTEDTFSAHKFNKYRGYLSVLYNEMIEYEAVEGNIIDGIKKRIHEKDIREVLSDDQRVIVNKYLRDSFPDFWRFTIIYFHSGGRIRELLDLKTEHVDLVNQTYKTLVKKGRQYVWVKRPIKDIAIDLWIKSLYNAQKGDYLFSDGLIPGPNRIRREQISRRWKMHIKDKFKIIADFSALKHLNLDETAAILSMADAAKMASHTSTKMVENHYAVGEKERQINRLKTIDNPFVKAS